MSLNNPFESYGCRTLLIFTQMRKPVAILFAAIYLFGTTEASQLLKLPVLVQHYVEHKTLNKSITFARFLEMHYLGKDEPDNDYQRDMQLPFKTIDACCMIAVNSLPPQRVQITVVEIPEIPVHKTATNDAFRHLYSPGSVFQPPRLA